MIDSFLVKSKSLYLYLSVLSATAVTPVVPVTDPAAPDPLFTHAATLAADNVEFDGILRTDKLIPLSVRLLAAMAATGAPVPFV